MHSFYRQTQISLLDYMQTQLLDQASVGAAAGVTLHFNRRAFLRYTLRAMLLLLTDKPGLLGPKVGPAVHLCVFVCVYVYVKMCMHMYMYMYICVYICVFICIDISARMCAYQDIVRPICSY